MVFQLTNAQQLGPQRLFVGGMAIPAVIAIRKSLAAEEPTNRLNC